MSKVQDYLYRGHRFPAEVIAYAVWLYFRFPLGLRMVGDLLAVRGIVVSHETIRRWAARTAFTSTNEAKRSNDFEPEICGVHARAMASSFRSRSLCGVHPRMPAEQNADLFRLCGHWPRHSLRPVSSTTQIACYFLRNVQSNKAGHRRTFDGAITRRQRPDRATIGRSSANRDYGMSTYVNARWRRRRRTW